MVGCICEPVKIIFSASSVTPFIVVGDDDVLLAVDRSAGFVLFSTYTEPSPALNPVRFIGTEISEAVTLVILNLSLSGSLESVDAHIEIEASSYECESTI